MTAADDFWVFAAVLAVAAGVALLGNLLRQPLIVSYIAVGILVGPVGLGLVSHEGVIELLAQTGIAMLLFMVGLRLDLHLIRTTGPVALATGIGQVVFTSVIGYGIALALGMDSVTALYVAVALTFSSTIIIVKLLSDKRELDQLHGRIAVGFLIVQDIVVVLVMIALTSFGRASSEAMPERVALTVGTGAGLLVGLALLARFVLPWLLHFIARSQELLVIFGVAYAVSVAALTEWLGFSLEVGAFLAGMSLASTTYRDALGARLVSLRDFLLLFFFIQLGAQLEFGDASRQLLDAGLLSVFVLIGNPLIVVLIMRLMGYPVRIGFLSGLSVAQISEFSLILAALGLSLGHITSTTLSLVTVVGLITIGISTYLILYSKQLYDLVKRWLEPLDRLGRTRRLPADLVGRADVILYGLGRMGRSTAQRIAEAGYDVLAVDYDPQRVARSIHPRVTTVYGSAEDVEFLESLPLATTPMVISAIPSSNVDLVLLHALQHHEYAGTVVLSTLTRRDAERLRAAGADRVVEPYERGADTILELVREHADRDGTGGPGDGSGTAPGPDSGPGSEDPGDGSGPRPT
ncbi:cation:proton antiporter [Nocardiopsis aegyptia]|uniref:Kef-type K+ transport system membrane component KefB n=1 Tax=Nocardiopsis aegyptia TaxID=220378 RepID=A0A7Z0ELT3_9ACTN|nr:cation:proton antiporter family protein [Nocardiopsis aegyptia]NYJ34242.1 Kef-type K+ transport system membrane component KefB [Nocardiopsis aegyptia]